MTIISYFDELVAFLVAVRTFWLGIQLIIEIKAITVGKASSQLLAVLFSVFAFYRIDSIPFVEELIPVITIDNTIVEWIFYAISTVAILYCLYNIYKAWDEESKKIKEDASVLKIIILFGISSACFGYIA